MASGACRLRPPVLIFQVLQPLGFLALHRADDERFAEVPGPPEAQRALSLGVSRMTLVPQWIFCWAF
jgi:hypothetical protein